jgi:DNA-binding transcriptional LysR family regulator
MVGPPLELLMAFGKVAERASITVAARDLGVSKATISKQLSELEAILGVVLFARTTRKLTLTDAGHKAYQRTRTIMIEAELLAEEAHDSQVAPRGRLKIAAPHAFSAHWLADRLPEFLRDYPDIQLEIEVDDRTIDVIEQGFDGAVRISSMPDSSLIARRLAPIQRHVVAAPAYWDRYGRPSHPSELVSHNCLRYANIADYSTWRFSAPAGDEVKVRVEGSVIQHGGNIELPIMRAGMHVAILPDFMVCNDVREGRLEIGLTDWKIPELTLHLLTPPGRGKTKRLEVFTEFLVRNFGGRVSPWKLL